MGEAMGLVIGGDNEAAMGLAFAAAVARSGSSTNARFNFFGRVRRANEFAALWVCGGGGDEGRDGVADLGAVR